MQKTLKQIRIRLRLAMNGVVSTSMREKGIVYKLNFGVSVPTIKQIANDFPASSGLAQTLWEQDVREMKILATLLQPADEFTKDQAKQWAKSIPYQEIAEQYTMNLIQHLPFASDLAQDWIQEDDKIIKLSGLLTFYRLLAKNTNLSPEQKKVILQQTRTMQEGKSTTLQFTALQVLKRLGAQSKQQAEEILSFFSDYALSNCPNSKTWYEELKIEFDYCD